MMSFAAGMLTTVLVYVFFSALRAAAKDCECDNCVYERQARVVAALRRG